MATQTMLAAVIALVVGMLLGAALMLDVVQRDCAALGKTRLGEVVVGCVVKP